MSEELEIFKKKLLYRASYRGTKEMDILLSSFVYDINIFSEAQLRDLENFEIEDNKKYLIIIITIKLLMLLKE